MDEHVAPANSPPDQEPESAMDRVRWLLSDSSSSGSSSVAEQEEEQDAANEPAPSEPDVVPANLVRPDQQETWQTFLQRVTPHEIGRREFADPVRRGYVQHRHHEATEEGHQRRRAATASTFTASGRHPGTPNADRPLPSPRDGARRRPMSLQIQDRPLPRPPSSGRELPSLPGEYVVPRWQPDHEVSYCPICGREFNLFFRRHHCRKCGRVVCANCSPHRITIPRQYIVHPPLDGEAAGTRSTQTDASDRTPQNEEGRSYTSALGGGEEVRLCNPCVPDPNPLPPPSYISPDGQHFISYPRTDSLPASSGSRSHRASMPPQPTHRFQTERGAPQAASAHGRRYDPSQRWSGGPNAFLSWVAPDDSRPGTSGFRSPHGSAAIQSRHAASWSISGPLAVPTSDPNAPLPPTPPPPPPPLREEDECPVCHLELPPKGPDGSEQAREAHVIACIQSHFSVSGPRSIPQPAPHTAVAAAVAASAASAAQAGGGPSSPIPRHATNGSVSGSYGSAPGPASSPRRRVPGMLVYHASEKDCVAEDGDPQECVICFEEFTVGIEMGRLECLCKFHRICIRQWWDTKGVGACPVHQDGI